MSYMIMISYEHSHSIFWCLDMQMSIFHQDLLWFFSIISITCFVQLRSLPEIVNPLRDEILFVISVSRLSSQGSPAICPLPLPGSSEPAYVTWQHVRNEASECVLSCCRDQDFWSFLLVTWRYVSVYTKYAKSTCISRIHDTARFNGDRWQVRLSQMAPWPLGSCPEEVKSSALKPQKDQVACFPLSGFLQDQVAGNYFRLWVLIWPGLTVQSSNL